MSEIKFKINSEWNILLLALKSLASSSALWQRLMVNLATTNRLI